MQIRIANIAESSSRWKILLEEHPWHSDETMSEGFLDLVLFKPGKYNRDAMVIECKRVRQTKWVFLIPKPKSILFSRACLWESIYTDWKWNKFDWKDHQVEPRSYEAKFCAIPGQEQGRGNLLERTAAALIQAIEALAWQEKELHERKATELKRGQDVLGSEFQRIYIPVIVTTAELMISHFEPGSISLKDGCLPPSSVFESVPVVRFRKSLATKFTPDANDIQQMHSMTERTVFIVNAEKFEEFLQDWNFQQLW